MAVRSPADRGNPRIRGQAPVDRLLRDVHSSGRCPKETTIGGLPRAGWGRTIPRTLPALSLTRPVSSAPRRGATSYPPQTGQRRGLGRGDSGAAVRRPLSARGRMPTWRRPRCLAPKCGTEQLPPVSGEPPASPPCPGTVLPPRRPRPRLLHCHLRLRACTRAGGGRRERGSSSCRRCQSSERASTLRGSRRPGPSRSWPIH